MSKEDKTRHNKKKLIEALEKSLGIVTTACKIADLHRSTYYEYYNGDLEFKIACDDINNVVLDFAESQLHKQIKDGNPSSTIFYLKTKGKNRGYFEKIISENKNENIHSGELKTEIDYSKIDARTLKNLIEQLKPDKDTE
tara:strand:+ start:1632 stop:2051 length:420 start_codon:yes stop_codon:yes gene_type:complete